MVAEDDGEGLEQLPLQQQSLKALIRRVDTLVEEFGGDAENFGLSVAGEAVGVSAMRPPKSDWTHALTRHQASSCVVCVRMYTPRTRGASGFLNWSVTRKNLSWLPSRYLQLWPP